MKYSVDFKAFPDRASVAGLSLGLIHNTDRDIFASAPNWLMEQNIPLEGRYGTTVVANGSGRQPKRNQQHSPLEDQYEPALDSGRSKHFFTGSKQSTGGMCCCRLVPVGLVNVAG